MASGAHTQDAAPDRVARLREAAASNPRWYHTIELAPGVVTEGEVDLRPVATKVLPDDLSGLRALDVGTFDGFWAFEMERRGAEVVAIDVDELNAADWPPLNRARLEVTAQQLDVELGRGFQIAAEALDSRVRRVHCDVRRLVPEAIGGPVDVAFIGALLLHLRDPVGALERVLGAIEPGGRLLALEPFSLRNTVLAPRRPTAEFQPLVTDFNWWYPNLAALRAWLAAAGFVEVRRRGFHRPPSARVMRASYCSLAARRPPAG